MNRDILTFVLVLQSTAERIGRVGPSCSNTIIIWYVYRPVLIVFISQKQQQHPSLKLCPISNNLFIYITYVCIIWIRVIVYELCCVLRVYSYLICWIISYNKRVDKLSLHQTGLVGAIHHVLFLMRMIIICVVFSCWESGCVHPVNRSWVIHTKYIYIWDKWHKHI